MECTGMCWIPQAFAITIFLRIIPKTTEILSRPEICFHSWSMCLSACSILSEALETQYPLHQNFIPCFNKHQFHSNWLAYLFIRCSKEAKRGQREGKERARRDLPLFALTLPSIYSHCDLFRHWMNPTLMHLLISFSRGKAGVYWHCKRYSKSMKLGFCPFFEMRKRKWLYRK